MSIEYFSIYVCLLSLPSSVDYVVSELSTMTWLSWVALHSMAHSFIELDKAWSMWSVWLAFCDCGFHSVCPLRGKDKRLREASWWGRLTVMETGSCSVGGAMLSKSLIQFSVDGWGCVPSLLFDLRLNGGGGKEDNGNLLQKVPCMHCCTQCPRPHSRPPPTHGSARDS